MKKQLLSLTLLASLLFPMSAFTLPPVDLDIDIEVEEWALDGVVPDSLLPKVKIQEGGQLYICNSTNLQQKICKTVGENRVCQSLPLDAFEGDNGDKSIALSRTLRFSDSYITNIASGIRFTNTKARTVSTDAEGRSISKISSSEGEATPYMDYIAADSNDTPCDSSRIQYGKLTFDRRNMNWVVVQLHKVAAEPSPEPAPEPAPEVAPPVNNGLQDNNAAPQSGGCSMSAVIPGMNYGLSILFALTLGAHALLRFRKE